MTAKLAQRKKSLARKIAKARQLARNQDPAYRRDKFMVRMLARTDAIFRPLRAADQGARGLLYLAWKEYQTDGARWRGGGGGGARRVRKSRELRELVESGRLIVTGEKVRTTHFRLPDAEMDALRQMVGLATHSQALPGLDYLLGLRDDHGRPRPGGPWISEAAIGQTEYGHPRAPDIFGFVQDDFLPLLVAGLVSSNSDGDGRVSYRLADDGERLAAQRLERDESAAETFPPDPGEGDKDMRHTYYTERLAERRRLRHARDSDNLSELGSIPLPVCWPGATI